MINTKANTESGKVFLVGAGTGDPDLLTVKAMRLIKTADVILYDRLVSVEIRRLFPKHTPALYVGKAKSNHSIPQDQLNQLMINEAKKGQVICRIKGGDPFVFGRGGEEMLALKNENISVEAVPGITAASGCTSYAGIPLTHRGLSQACTFVTGHGETDLDVNWRSLASMQHTLVFYMGLTNSSVIQEQLISNNLSPYTPVAVIERGSTPKQRVITGALHELCTLIADHNIESPSLIVIGDVVNLAEQLAWFSDVTRFQPQLQQLSA